MPRFTRVFDQDEIRLMATALDGAWNYLRCRGNELAQPDRAETTRSMLARRIIAAARPERRQYGELLISALSGVMRNGDFAAGEALRPLRSKATRTWSGL